MHHNLAQVHEHRWTYVIVRSDLPVAQQGIQAGHAAYECGRLSRYDEHPSLVYLEVANQEQLLEAQRYVESLDLETFPFFEPYQDWGLTAFAVEPVGQAERARFRQFKLWRR